MLRNDDAARLKIVQNAQALRLELGYGNSLFFKHEFILRSDQSSDQFICGSADNQLEETPLADLEEVFARI